MITYTKYNKKHIKTIINTILFSMIPISVFFLFMMINWNGTFPDIYMYHLGDGLTYHSIIESVVLYGEPIGYYVYNEALPEIGGIGPWSPFIIYFYAIIGGIWGYSINSLIVYNITLISLAFALFYLLAKPNRTQIIIIACIYPLLFTSHIFGFSYLVEGLFYFGVITLAGIIIHVIKKGGASDIIIIMSYLIVVFLSLCRIYYLIFLVIPIVFSIEEKNIKKSLIKLIIFIISFVILQVMIVSKFASPYFVDLYDTSMLSMLLKGDIVSFFEFFIHQTKDIINNLGYIYFKSTDSYLYSPTYTSSLIILLFYIIAIIKGLKSKNKISNWSLIISALIFMGLIIANLYFYNMFVAVRHLSSVIIFSVLILSYFYKKINLKMFIPLLLIFFYVACYTPFLSNYSKLESSELQYNQEELEEFHSYFDINSSYSMWDNTVGIISLDYMDYSLIPDGAGINKMSRDVILNEEINLKSKYYLVSDDDIEIFKKLETNGYKLIGDLGAILLFYKIN